MKKVRFFFPDSHDYVDPTFDFEKETNNEHRVIQRDDKYAHELFSSPVYDGILVSKAVVDGVSGIKGKYSVAQRQRFFREGIYSFFRLPRSYETMGDCGAFAYAGEEVPPYTVDEVAEFYDVSGFTYGISVDHIIFGFENISSGNKSRFDENQLQEFKRRKDLTLELANDFLKVSKSLSFEPYGVAHGWDVDSYADSVNQLQKMGFTKIAVGGLVPLKSIDVLLILEKINSIRLKSTELHLLGLYRLEYINRFLGLGVTSFDSTSPLMKGLKDDKLNYDTLRNGYYTSIGVPQVEANLSLKKMVASGKVDQNVALLLENKCLNQLIQFDKGESSTQVVLETLCDYEKIYNLKKSRKELFEKALNDAPWKDCECEICTKIGIHVLLKRGAQRNRRRGFHNLYVAYLKLQIELKLNTNE